ncbi:MAG: hypothetical protein N3B10_15565, partial [Armatimonadetes bacterium]|nr:hypothetical protein [Armatimonadota bacterium]
CKQQSHNKSANRQVGRWANRQIGRWANRQVSRWAGRQMENCRKTVGTGEACPRNRADFVRPYKICGRVSPVPTKTLDRLRPYSTHIDKI